jgi:sugar transferase (PEP-CTERM/EpsH1 system associated)
MSGRNGPPLIAHIIYRLGIGGLENGLVNILNNMPEDAYGHAVICLDGYEDFRARILRDDVEIYSLNKRSGKDLRAYVRLWRLLARLRPDIVHTRNLGTLDALIPAYLAGVPHRIHGEHGREITDLLGQKPKHVWLRRLLSPLVERYIPMSADLARWLHDCIGIRQDRIVQIYSGVDVEKFRPSKQVRLCLPRPGFADAQSIIVGSVGRMDHVKDQLTLARAFVHLVRCMPEYEDRLRLVHVGDGPLMEAARSLVGEAGVAERVWLAGSRDDVADLLRGIDIFVLPSLAEGISNTILEAMATALPVVATRVGGNPELVTDGVTGTLVAAADSHAMARVLASYVASPELRRAHGTAGRRRVEREFTIERMVTQYKAAYDHVLFGAGASRDARSGTGEFRRARKAKGL